MQGKNILVIGDMVADIYLVGLISRISREAPVLVLQQAEEKVVAGGAANVFAVGLLGMDNAAKGLKEALAKNGVHTEGLICDEKRQTISKMRMVAGGRATVSQQIVRIDRESNKPMSKLHENQISQYIKMILPQIDGVVFSDYGSGTITEKIQQQLIAYCRAYNIPSIVDSHYNIHRFKDVGYVKQNDAELAVAVGLELGDDESIFTAGQKRDGALRKKWCYS